MTYLAPLLWYGLISLAGILLFPLVYRLFPALPDRGYTISRVTAWLLWGFTFWLLASLGILQNTPFSIFFAFCILLVVSFLVLRKMDRQEFMQWFRSNRTWILIAELISLLSFITLVLFRATNPEIVGTEKSGRRMKLSMRKLMTFIVINSHHTTELLSYFASLYLKTCDGPLIFVWRSKRGTRPPIPAKSPAMSISVVSFSQRQ